MTWRYQPVYTDDAVGRAMILHRCFFDADDRLVSWTEKPVHPQGDTAEELLHDLIHMIADTQEWPAVPFGDLHVGMIFERRRWK